MTTLLPQPREVGTPSIVTREQFQQQFNTFTTGIFEGFDFSNIVVIGGSVVGSLLPIPTHLPRETNEDEHELPRGTNKDEREQGKAEQKDEEPKEQEEKNEENKGKANDLQTESKKETPSPKEYYASHSPFKSSDIDLCIYGVTQAQFRSKIEQIYNHLVKKVGNWNEANNGKKGKDGNDRNDSKGIKEKEEKEEKEQEEEEEGKEGLDAEDNKEEAFGKVVKIYASNSTVVLSGLFPFRHVQITLTYVFSHPLSFPIFLTLI